MSLTVALGVLATPLELALPTCPGQIGFVLMLIPTFMAAFDGGHRSGFFTGLTGSVCICLAAWIANWGRVTGGLNLLVPIVMPVIWAVVLAGCGFWLGRCLDSIRQHAADLREQCNQHERAIYQLHKDSHEVAATAEQERVRRQQIEAQQLDFSRLLLNIQHLGRELSGHLEMQGVSRLATEAARKLLKVPSARLFLIDETTRDLVEMTPGREGDRFAGGRGMLGWSVRHRQIITAEDVAKNHELADLPAQDVATWQACAPLVFDNQVLGVLGIDTAEQKGKDFDRLLYIVASFSAVAVNNGRMFQRAQEQARRDGLTGLWNHATFQRRLAELLAEAKTSGRPVSMVLADVDFFKKFNDMHGHQAGDHVLRSVAALWQRLIPKSAMAARYGGEEFVFVLPGTDVGAAAEFAESLRFAVANETIEFDGTTLMVSASFGVAGWPTNGELPAQLIRSADMALYSAKRGGRNRVALAAPGEPPDIRRTEITSAQTLAGLSRSAHEA
jgi:diguanylate cyclase (GGDEF)-like protein